MVVFLRKTTRGIINQSLKPRRARRAGSGSPNGSGCSVSCGPNRIVLYASNCVRCSFLGNNVRRHPHNKMDEAITTAMKHGTHRMPFSLFTCRKLSKNFIDESIVQHFLRIEPFVTFTIFMNDFLLLTSCVGVDFKQNITKSQHFSRFDF